MQIPKRTDAEDGATDNGEAVAQRKPSKTAAAQSAQIPSPQTPKKQGNPKAQSPRPSIQSAARTPTDGPKPKVGQPKGGPKPKVDQSPKKHKGPMVHRQGQGVIKKGKPMGKPFRRNGGKDKKNGKPSA